MRNKYPLCRIFFDQLEKIWGCTFEINEQGTGILIVQPEEIQYYFPNMNVKNLMEFEEVLQEYYNAVKKSDIKMFKETPKHNMDYFLFKSVSTVTSSDCEDIAQYITRLTQFIKDDTFSEYDHCKINVGSICGGKYSILVERQGEYNFLETPYMMKFYVCNRNITYQLPLIRYGICEENGQKVAYIYAVQQKKKYDRGDNFISEIENDIRMINSGVKENRNVTPSMLFALSMFVVMLKKEGINIIRVPDFVCSRYGEFRNKSSEKEIDETQENITNKFLRMFLRLDLQIDGFNIYQYPNELGSSFMEMKIENTNFGSNNPLLMEVFELFKDDNELSIPLEDNGDIFQK